MAVMDHALKNTVPYYNTIKRGMAAVPKEKTKKRRQMQMLTEYNISESKPILKSGVTVNQAAKKLYEYEKFGKNPEEIGILIERVESLEQRIKRLEEW